MLELATALAGLVGALLMFAGDMLLYYTSGPYDMDGTLVPYARLMAGVPRWRVRIGALLGSVAALLYVAGFSHIVLFASEAARPVAVAVWVVLSVAISVGGAYHAQFALLPVVGRREDEGLTREVCDTIAQLVHVYTPLLYLGPIVLFGMVLLGFTSWPWWAAVLTPAVTEFLGFVWLRVPQPFKVVLFGGWSNLVFVIFFGAVLVMCVL